MDAPFPKRHLGAKVDMSLNHVTKGEPKMKIATIGTDLAKSVIQIHGIDPQGNTFLRNQLKRNQMMEFFTRLEPCMIGMKACGSAHHWARKLWCTGLVLLIFVLYPLICLLLPLRIVGVGVEAVFELLRAIVMLPTRIRRANRSRQNRLCAVSNRRRSLARLS